MNRLYKQLRGARRPVCDMGVSAQELGTNSPPQILNTMRLQQTLVRHHQSNNIPSVPAVLHELVFVDLNGMFPPKAK
eukprot:5185088-Amphidinium_carterae.2